MGRKHCRHEAPGHQLSGKSWRTTSTAEQQATLDNLRVTFAKNKAQLKAAINGLKIQLAVLATANMPQTEAMNAKIEELLGVKREMLATKYAHIAAQRAVLTPQQQTSFDMDVLQQAMHRNKGRTSGSY